MLARHPAARPRPPAARLDGRPSLLPRAPAAALLSSSRPRRAARSSSKARATSTDDTTSSSSSSSSAAASADSRLRSTISDLDALLGVVEDDKSNASSSSSSSTSAAGPLSQPALERTAAEGAARISAAAQQQQQQQQQSPPSSSSSTGPSNLDGAISEQMKKILERAKALAEQQQLEQQQQQQQQQQPGSGNNNPPPPAATPEEARAQQEALRQEFEQLLDAVFATSGAAGAGGGPLSEQEEAARRGTMTKSEVAALRECGAFGPTTFWITEVRCLSPEGFVGGPADRERAAASGMGGGAGAGAGAGGFFSSAPPASAAPAAAPGQTAAAAAPPPSPEFEPLLTLSDRVGVLVRGNLRARRADVFRSVQDKVREAFAGRYEVLLVPDPDALLSEDDDGGGGGGGPSPQQLSAARARRAAAAASGKEYDEEEEDDLLARVAFHIVPAAVAQPPASSGAGAFQLLLAAGLLGLLVAACVQLALVANVAKLPAETLRYFSDPSNFDTSGLESGAAANPPTTPPGLDTWDPRPYIASALPVAAATLGVTLAQEGSRRAVSLARGVRLGPTYFIPNLQIGSFGAITPVASLLPSRRELWDVAAAAPLAGAAASAALLFAGLAQSHVGEPGSLPAELLVPVPAQLLQGSLLLGSITRAALGDGAAAAAAAAVQAASSSGGGGAAGPIAAAVAGQPVLLLSPLAVAGWCGCVTTALNLLPVGSLDGGRMFQASYGRQALALSSFFTYVGLGLGLIGSSLSLPFGLYVLICRRGSERYVRDSVTPVPKARRYVTAAAVLAAVLVLLPVAPEVADQVVGVGGGGGAGGGGGFNGFL